MIRHNLNAYFAFGSDVRFLMDIVAGNQVKHVTDVIGRMGGTNRCGGMNLPVSINALSVLTVLLDELKELPAESTLGAPLANRIRAAADKWQATVSAELRDRTAYILTEKWVDVNKLAQEVTKLFPPKLYESLPDLTRYDLREAAACIAFERPTAGAFHLMRATEYMVRELYFHLVRQKRIKDRNWGPLMTDLSKRPRGKEHATLISHLDHIRKNFRNPTQHPDKTYDMIEVQELWNLSVDAITRVAKVLAKSP